VDKYAPILIVGNTAHDILISEQHPITQCLGGSAPYISNVLEGLNIPYYTISNVGEDFKYFDQCAFIPRIIKKTFTTTFINYTSCIPRKQKVLKKCKPILPTDININTDISLICGIIGEILPETIKKIRSKSKILVCDIQGLIRTVTDDNKIVHTHIQKTLYSNCIFLFDFIKMSEEELEFVDLKRLVAAGISTLITKGEKGCEILAPAANIHIPAFPTQPIDNTGAGDCFLAGFAAGLYNKLSIYDSIVLGHQCGHIAVKFLGIPSINNFTIIGREKIINYNEL
jgi:1D-myo-inositol 3-kinase